MASIRNRLGNYLSRRVDQKTFGMELMTLALDKLVFGALIFWVGVTVASQVEIEKAELLKEVSLFESRTAYKRDSMLTAVRKSEAKNALALQFKLGLNQTRNEKVMQIMEKLSEVHLKTLEVLDSMEAMDDDTYVVLSDKAYDKYLDIRFKKEFAALDKANSDLERTYRKNRIWVPQNLTKLIGRKSNEVGDILHEMSKKPSNMKTFIEKIRNVNWQIHEEVYDSLMATF